MRQVLQSLRTGGIELAEVPAPGARPGHVLVRTSRTLISPGTERMLVGWGEAGWIERARREPDKVRQVLDKVRTDGVVPAFEAVRARLDRPLPLGYCNVGRVVEAGGGVDGLPVGRRVVSNGAHAELVLVPKNLYVPVPDGVSDEDAAFAVIGAVALQGIRLIAPTLGEAVAVTGLGLVGLLAVQLLRANGCRVLGLDFDAERLALAEGFGAQVHDLSLGDPLAAAERFSRGRGVDAVLIATATATNDPVRQAAAMCRQRGRIVLTGVAGLELSRADFYEKELSFTVSCSYGPGRHDPNYEERGQDYPFGLVRWTERRNIEAVLDLMAGGRLDLQPLVSHRFPFSEAERAYALLTGPQPSLGILLECEEPPEPAPVRRSLALHAARAPAGAVAIGVIGAGGYARAVLIPAFARTQARFVAIASIGGVNALNAGRRFGFARVATDVGDILADPALTGIVIATRHDSHADLVVRALEAGQHVFVEKPLALTLEELERIEDAARVAPDRILAVGFNRRFAPLVVRMKTLLAARPGPKSFVMTVNAGRIAPDHWTQDEAMGGGRILGEACHFVDLLRHLVNAPIVEHRCRAMASLTPDTVSIDLSFADGSIGTIHYFANGHRSLRKERLEVFADGAVLRLDNFRRLEGHGWPGFRRAGLWRQDKGQRAMAARFVHAIETGGEAPIGREELFEVARVSIELAREARR